MINDVLYNITSTQTQKCLFDPYSIKKIKVFDKNMNNLILGLPRLSLGQLIAADMRAGLCGTYF